jgi:hypothetical protein
MGQKFQDISDKEKRFNMGISSEGCKTFFFITYTLGKLATVLALDKSPQASLTLGQILPLLLKGAKALQGHCLLYILALLSNIEQGRLSSSGTNTLAY